MKTGSTAFSALALILVLAACANASELLVARNVHGNAQSDFETINADQRVNVPYSSSLRMRGSRDANAEIVFSRGCANVTVDKLNGLKQFPDLTCRYTKHAFVGCFRGASATADPFFVEGQEVFFASAIELRVVLPSPHRAAFAALHTSAYLEDSEFCESTNTIEGVAQMYGYDTLAQRYNNFFAYMSPLVTMEVNVFKFVYDGIVAVFSYHLLGDSSISDAFLQLDTKLVTMTSEGNVVMANWFITVKSLQLPEGPDPQNPLNVYTDNQIHELTFDEYGRIASINLYINTATVFAFFPQANNPDIGDTCATIQQLCVGPNQQFTSEAACVQFMNSIPYINGPVAQSVGSNSVACRAFHTALSGPFPEGHCFHTGPYWVGDILSTPCNDASSVINPPPARKVSHSSRSPSSNPASLSVCEGSEFCKFGVVSHEVAFNPKSLALERAMLNNIPAAAQIVADHSA